MRVVLDTNIIVSAIIFGGKPREVLHLAIEQRVAAITSELLLAEALDVLTKKFHISSEHLTLIEQQLRSTCTVVKPRKVLHVVVDDADNRVLEAAAEGLCDAIITGDKELLDLAIYQDLRIVSAAQFLKDL